MARVYVLYTGGTIGCVGTPLAPMAGPDFLALMQSMPGLAGGKVAGYPVDYEMGWFERSLDSSNMTPADWIRIAQALVAVYDEYDGFVVLHGTDTMAFTASALSFLLPGLSKPVVLTGAQVPLAMTLTDALTNLIGALVVAGTARIPECLICFGSLVLRGNRAAKINANQFAAFASPNLAPLGTIGGEIAIDAASLLPPPDAAVSLADPRNLTALAGQLERQAARVADFSVIAMTLYPGIGASTAEAMIGATVPPVRGVVIEAFGAGNAPSTPDFLAALAAANAAGVVLVDNSQVLSGSVMLGAYATGSGLAGAGVISAHDMTPEASLAKLVVLISAGHPPARVKALMQSALAGEITLPPDPRLPSPAD